MAENIELKENGSNFDIKLNGKKEKVKVPVGGEHFILNSLCAILVGKILDIPNTDIIKGIETFELTKKRMEIIELKEGIKIINDTYNSSVESVEASLKYMNNFKGCRKIAVLGDILESGDFAKELHQKVGEKVYENNIDILICRGENSKYIAEKAEEKGFDKNNIYYFEDKEKIISLLQKIAKKDDVILFKASNGMKFFELVDKIKEKKL